MANYKFLEYIQSSGTQYIDTGVFPTSKTKMECTIAYTSSTSQYSGIYTSGSFFMFGAVGTSYEMYYANKYIGGGTFTVNKQINIIIDGINKTASIDGTLMDYSSVSYTTSPISLPIGVLKSTTETRNYSYFKLYSYKVYENNVIIRDFHPAKRLSDNAIGLYDSVNNVFYTNAGTGTFTAGPELSIENFYACDYIESTGTQYIDTNFKHNQDTRIVMDVQLISPSSSNWWLFGGRTSNFEHRHDIFYYGTSTKLLMTDYNTSSTNRTSFPTITPSDRLYVDYNKNVCNINDATVTHTPEVFQCNYNLYLLAINTSSASTGYAHAKLYSCQIYDNDVLIHNYIPFCNEDLSLIGLYDSITDSYFMNSGTGSFKMSGSLKPLTATSVEEPEERTVLYLGDTKADQVYANGLPVDIYIF